MAETEWTEEAPPPKKKSVPTWAWACGAGCLLMVIVGAGVGWLGVSLVKSSTDPEVQWPKLAKVLPFDERPPHLELKWGSQIGVQQYQLWDDRGMQIVVQRAGGAQGDAIRSSLFESDEPSLPGQAGMITFDQVEQGTIEIQGREMPVLRVVMGLGGLLEKMVDEEDAEEGMGATAYVDVTAEDEDGLLFVQLTRTGGKERVTDEEILRFFEHFHVGPNR